MIRENVLLRDTCKALEIKLGEKLSVTKEFIGKVTAQIYCDRRSSEAIKTHIREAFEKAGLEVKDG